MFTVKVRGSTLDVRETAEHDLDCSRFYFVLLLGIKSVIKHQDLLMFGL